jgi:GGDEF domain-containing protein
MPPTIQTMDNRHILIDAESGLHVAWYFWLRVLDEVGRSGRYGNPFGLLLLDLECDPGVPPRSLDEAAALVPGAIRGTDLAGRLGAQRVGVILLEQDAEGALAATARLLGDLAAGPRGVRWKHELLAYPRDAADISHMLTTDPRRELVPELERLRA